VTTRIHRTFFFFVGGLLFAHCEPGFAQYESEKPYFVTYSSQMAEVGTLEIEFETVTGRPVGGNRFFGNLTEFEYGITHWWTAELYLDWQHTRHEGSLFTGFRFENRFALLPGDHRVKPVLYVEYEHLNGADKTLKEVVGFDSQEDLAVPNDVARQARKREIETKLILSTEFRSWDLSGNFITDKNVHGEPWEFGYAVGLSRPLAAATGRKCALCREAFAAGVEMYGGLGTWNDFTVHGTSQYLVPVVSWTLPSHTTLRFSPGVGLTEQSVGTLFRFSVAQEIDDFGRLFTKPFHKN
jgi:hypothetical protein